jgi:bifunctional UDP-N-acetylglucosamine pyrophosphorylase/glucosamine-1-phosphate N-acetyltransferase
MNQIVILAAGKGTRMNSDLPKALVPLKDRPMITYLLDSVIAAAVDPEPLVVVSPENKEVISQALKDYKVRYIIQDQQLGTGHAVACAQAAIDPATENIIVLYCDHPFVTAESLRRFSELKPEALTIMPTLLPDYEDWRNNFSHWGRIVRDNAGRVTGIVEFKDATEEERAITEVNPGFMCFNNRWLWPHIQLLNNDNQQKEYYLTALAGVAFDKGFTVETVNVEPQEAMGINSVAELQIAESLL